MFRQIVNYFWKTETPLFPGHWYIDCNLNGMLKDNNGICNCWRKKLNSFIYESDEYQYIKTRASNNFTYLRCTLSRNSGCEGFAKIDHASNTLIKTYDYDPTVYKRVSNFWGINLNELLIIHQIDSKKFSTKLVDMIHADHQWHLDKWRAVCAREDERSSHLSPGCGRNTSVDYWLRFSPFI